MKSVQDRRFSFLYSFCGLALILLATGLAGCASVSGHRPIEQRDLVKAGEIKLDSIPSKRAKVLWASVRQDDDTLHISGVARQICYAAQGCCIDLEIELLDSSGTRLEQTVVHQIWVPRRVAGRVPGWVRFHAELPATVPMGTRMRFKCKSSSTRHS